MSDSGIKWVRLTLKEREALDLVLDRLSSKQIAKRLGLSPKTIDQRLDSARSKLGAATRVDAARSYAELLGTPERLRYQPFPLPDDERLTPRQRGVSDEAVYTFGDAAAFRPGVPWERVVDDWSAPKFRGKSLGTGPLLVIILAGAGALLAVVLLGLGVMQGLNTIISG